MDPSSLGTLITMCHYNVKQSLLTLLSELASQTNKIKAGGRIFNTVGEWTEEKRAGQTRKAQLWFLTAEISLTVAELQRSMIGEARRSRPRDLNLQIVGTGR